MTVSATERSYNFAEVVSSFGSLALLGHSGVISFVCTMITMRIALVMSAVTTALWVELL